MLNQLLLLYILNAVTNFERFKTNLTYSDIIIIKKLQVITDPLLKLFVARHGSYLNCYRLIKPWLPKI